MIEEDKKFEDNIKDIFTKEIVVPYHAKNTIRQTLLKKQENNKNKYYFIKSLVACCVCCILITGVVFAKDISNIINFFVNNEGMDNAIENNYIDNPNIEYINSEGVGLKLISILMDDYNLSLELNIKGDFITENIDNISFIDMIITDENKNILYCEDKDTFEEYCKNNNLEYIWKENNENYINSGSNWYIKSINEDSSINLVYNLFADKYPKSKNLFIKVGKILVTENEKEIILEGNWNIEYDVPSKFYNREEIVYNVQSYTSDKIKIIQLIVSETTTKMQLITDEKPILPYDLDDSEEEKERKIQEQLEKEQNMTIEDFENNRKFKNEYIENEKGEKFYPSNSTSEDTGFSYIDMNYLLHWQTFNLNKYNTTENLKLYINYNGEDIVVELKRKIN